jgi:hypothetical protein
MQSYPRLEAGLSPVFWLCRKFSFEAIYGMISLHDPWGILREKDDGD